MLSFTMRVTLPVFMSENKEMKEGFLKRSELKQREFEVILLVIKVR